MRIAVKQLSTRFGIVKRSKGQSAVEKASYISRGVLYCEYDGRTYRPKYHEDLVHSEISLPDNAPEEFADRATLWNSVELSEKGQKAQLARILKASLPNNWSYETAEETVRDYVQRNFVSQGMCADWAIHDSENAEGQRNLHVHVLLTMRPLTPEGRWGAKQRKVYIFDENGNKIRNANGKGYKATTKSTTDWNDKKKAKLWRKDLAGTINAVNERLGISERWEHRSFREQGIAREPTIHLGARASALERKGIQTERGNINREIIRQNNFLQQAEAVYEAAKERVEKLKHSASIPMEGDKPNEVISLIDRIAEKKGRLDLPIIGAKHMRRIRNRGRLQSVEKAKQFISTRGIGSFGELSKFFAEKERKCSQLDETRLAKIQRLNRLEALLEMYVAYEPLKVIQEKSLSLKGLAKIKYNREHKEELERFPQAREDMASLLRKGEKLSPRKWEKERKGVEKEIGDLDTELAKTITELSYAEVIRYNKKCLDRTEADHGMKQGRRTVATQKRKKQDMEL